MKHQTHLLRGIMLLVTLGLGMTLSIGKASAQYVYPTFKMVTVNGNANNKATTSFKYVRIANASSSNILTSIDRANRRDVFGNDVLSIGDQAAANKVAYEYTDAYYEGMWELPYQNLTQNVSVIRGGKYVQFISKISSYFGGAHGLYGENYECYNLYNGNKLNLDYLRTGSWASYIKRLLYNRCREQLGSEFMVSSYSEFSIAKAITLSEFGVVFVYQQYEISSGAMGVVTIELSDSEIANTGAPKRW